MIFAGVSHGGLLTANVASGLVADKRFAVAGARPFGDIARDLDHVRIAGAGMTRDETIALFLECEAKRGQARAAALAEGKSDREAGEVAHEAAKAHWNAWAEALLAERKAMEAAGTWAAERDWRDVEEGQNDETRDWLAQAEADFSP